MLDKNGLIRIGSDVLLSKKVIVEQQLYCL